MLLRKLLTVEKFVAGDLGYAERNETTKGYQVQCMPNIRLKRLSVYGYVLFDVAELQTALP